ncbi:MAG: hypothetical protein RLZZ568_1136 [Cyanobacteriota bacterium]
MGKSTQPAVNHDTAKPWWKKGIFSANNWFGRWFQKKIAKYFRFRATLSESDLFLYRRAITHASTLGKKAELIDAEKFSQPEFLLLIKLRYLLDQNSGEYTGIKDSLARIQAAIAAKDSLFAITQTELRFRGSQQQAFYQFTDDLLRDCKDAADFQQRLQRQIAVTMTQIKTDEGRVAMEDYSAHLDALAKNPVGLKLLGLFKADELSDLSIFRQLSDWVHALTKQDLQNHQTLAPLVANHYESLAKIGAMVDLPQSQCHQDAWTRIIQVLALNHKYHYSCLQFEELLAVLKRWYSPYQTAISIREAHPPNQFKQPPAFQDNIPGEKVYLKYKRWL